MSVSVLPVFVNRFFTTASQFVTVRPAERLRRSVCGGAAKPDFTFFLYEHGFQPSGLKIDVLLNKERLEIGRAFGYDIHALEDFAGVDKIDSWEPMYAMGHGSHALTSIAGPNDIHYRYLTEDIPIALVCWASIADQLGIDTPIMDAVITLVGVAHDTNWFEKGRSAKALGLEGKGIEEIKRYAQTGRF